MEVIGRKVSVIWKTSSISRTKSQNLNVSFILLQFVFAQSIEARCQVENEDVVGAAPPGAEL